MVKSTSMGQMQNADLGTAPHRNRSELYLFSAVHPKVHNFNNIYIYSYANILLCTSSQREINAFKH